MKNNYFKITFWFGIISIILVTSIVSLIWINLYPFVMDRLPNKHIGKDNNMSFPTDTMVYVDTVRFIVPVEKKQEVIRPKTLIQENKTKDTSTNQDTTKSNSKDTNLINVP
jgi:hypothetical protein